MAKNKKKYCWYCKKTLNISFYHKAKNRSDGLQGMCKICHKLYRKNWLSKNKEKYKKTCQEWSIKNKEKCRALAKRWVDDNREYFRERQRIYKSTKRKTDPLFRITGNLRTRIRKAVKGINKSKTTIELLGCNIEQFRLHIENQFKPGMTWENYGQWELDHIKPCCSFNLLDEEEQKKCFNYLNIQPLWKEEHRQKTIQDTKNYLSDF